jgi:hypothetical protein
MLKLPGVRRIQICDVTQSPQLRKDLLTFAHAWIRARAMLRQRGLEQLTEGVDIVMVGRRGYYARFWHDDILCVSLRAMVDHNPVEILLHELGHRVWFKTMGRRSRTLWAEDHQKRLRERRPLPSKYARESTLEDYAESFRMQVQGKLRGGPLVRHARLGPDYRKIQHRLRKAIAA